MFWSGFGAQLLAAAVGSAFGAGLITAVVKLAKIRAQRVKHVHVSGTDLYRNGVPLTEAQFREAWDALHAELDELGPQADRNEWQLKQGFAAINRFAVLTGTYPHAFPMLGDADLAWEWYAANNPYATGADPSSTWTLEGLWGGPAVPSSPAGWSWPGVRRLTRRGSRAA